MAIRKIRYEDDDILRKKSKPIKEVNKKIKDLINDMIETMQYANGVGIAAPQVGILKRVVIVDIGEGPVVLVNPEIVKTEGSNEVTEGCLSIPGRTGVLLRPQEITISALNENGEETIIESVGDTRAASILSHELDHLDGILYTDKIIKMNDDDDDEDNFES